MIFLLEVIYIWNYIRNNQGGITQGGTFPVKQEEHRDSQNTIKTISCNKSKALSKFLEKATDLEFIHGMKIKKNIKFYLKVTK